MKRTAAWGLLILLAGALAAPTLIRRHVEEKHDRAIALSVDWAEVHDLAARLNRSDDAVMQDLKANGILALVLSPTTLNDLYLKHRAFPEPVSARPDPFDVSKVRFTDRTLAAQIISQLNWKEVSGLTLENSHPDTVVRLGDASFAALKDLDVGFDPKTLSELSHAGLYPILRIYGDPWLSATDTLNVIAALPKNPSGTGLLFSSDDLPGGLAMAPAWRDWIAGSGATQFLSELHPALASWQMARALPANTYRLHSIPVAELRDLKPAEQLSRWRRAVDERTCRCLLIHAAPSDSYESFLKSVSAVHALLQSHGWTDGFPAPRTTWQPVSFLRRTVCSVLAFLLAVLVPLAALRRAQTARGTLPAFFQACAVTVLGSLLVAALAQNPETRLEIMPFRGIKLAFILSWGLAVLMIYSPRELKGLLAERVKRWEIFAALAGLAAVGYILVRTGNASAAWKNPYEQSVRDWLELTLIARPRFKEFCIGHPAMILGLYLRNHPLRRVHEWDSRGLIWIGVVGQISIVNTFCHLHSPLALELQRTLYGILFGALIGWVAVSLLDRMGWKKKKSEPELAARHRDVSFTTN